MLESGTILLDLLIVFVAAKIGGELAERIKQPPVVGEAALGIIIGSGIFGVTGHSETVAVLSTVGASVLLFLVGLETDIKAIRAVGFRAVAVAVLGVILPFAIGFAAMALRGASTVESMFLATTLVATSVGITARVLSDLGVLGRVESRIILAAAVLDDILGLLVLSMVTAFAKAGSIPIGELAVTLGKGLLFVAVATILPTFLLNRHNEYIDRLRHRNALFSVALTACIGFSVLAEQFGLAAIVGAFLAGMGFANVPGHGNLKKDFTAVGDFLIPLFFVAIGMQVDIASLMSPGVLIFGLVITALAVLSKIVGCGLGAYRLGLRPALTIGMGMVPRGEVGFIVATIGMSLGALPKDLVSAIILVSILTTIIVPPFLPLLFGTSRNNTEMDVQGV